MENEKQIKKGDFVRINKPEIGLHSFYPMAKVLRVNKNKGFVFVDFGDGTISRYRLEKVELM